MRDLTETKLRSELLVQGAFLQAYHDIVQLPNGGEAYREWIDHPGASAAVPLFADGTTLLVRQFRYPPHETFLEVPAGKFDHPDEPPDLLAARELEEETGWKAATFSPLGMAYPCIGYSNERIFFFLAENLTPTQQNLSEGELVEVVRMPFTEAVHLARSGALRDMKTVFALTRAAYFLEQRSVKNV